MSHSIQRVRNIRASFLLILTGIVPLLLAASSVQFLNVRGRMDRWLENPAIQDSAIHGMRSLCAASFFVCLLSFGAAIVGLVIVQRVLRESQQATAGNGE